MKKQKKSILGAIALSAALMTAVCFSACTPDTYSIGKLGGDISGAVSSNGGFVAQKGDYVYFINGEAAYNADNTFGNVVKGALMRIKEADLADGDYEEAETVVPMLFVSQNYDSGIYIYGDYVYYATPTKDTDEYGNVKNTMLDFKRAKLDGSDTMGGYFFRSNDNSGQFRFVEGKNGDIYCLYVESGTLMAFNTSTYEKKVLVKGASSYFFDESDAESGKVYYTMSVTDKIDSDAPFSCNYSQIYCVTPDAYATVDGDAGAYTVYSADGEYRTYDYDKGYLEGNLSGYNAWDYTTYPYVNLGELVLDGIGSNKVLCPTTMYNNEADVTATEDSYVEKCGYTYTLKSYQNGGVYYTRSMVMGDTDSAMYFLSETETESTAWNTVEGNFAAKLETVAKDNTFASNGEVIYTYDGSDHLYIYSDGSAIYKAGTAYATPIKMTTASSATLFTLKGDYLYYGENNTLTRINYMGADEDLYEFGEYDLEEEYKASVVAQVSLDTAWYKPEFVGEVLLYNNANKYNYIYAIDLGVEKGGTVRAINAKELNALIEKYNDFEDYILNDITDDAIRNAMRYVFQADSLEAFEAVKDLYTDVQIEEVKAFYERRLSTNKSANDYTDKFLDDDGVAYDRIGYFVNQVGDTSSADAQTIAAELTADLLSEEDATEDESFPAWAIVLISVGGALLVGAGVAIPVVYFYKKKKKRLADIESTRVRKRKRIDTTDDKTIDVYADESAEEVEEKAEESIAEESKEAVEESVETAVEEATEEKADDGE